MNNSELSSKFKRNDNLIKSKLEFKDNQLIAKDKLYIIYPKRFEEIGFGSISRTVDVLGVFIIMDEDYNYALVIHSNMFTLTPKAVSEINNLLIDGKDYRILEFDKGGVIMPSSQVIKDMDVPFKILDYFLVRNNNLPFYVGYNELIDLFLRMPDDAGSTLGVNPFYIGVMLSYAGRDKKTNKYARQVYSKKDMTLSNVTMVGLMDALEGYDNVLSKLTSMNMRLGLISALGTSDHVDTVLDDILMK